MTRRPAFSLALFLLVVLMVITLAGIGLVQEPPPESSGPDALLIAQALLDAVPVLSVLASAGIGLGIGRLA
jgi:hypothetical protein